MEKPIRALVLAADYSNPNGKIKLHYIHMRNLYYVQHGIEVTVINFRAQEAYTLDGIRVIPLKDYRAEPHARYDVLISHAPNLRNHYLFLKRYQHRFEHLVFVFHGHEVLRLRDTYPKPYSFMPSTSAARRLARDVYDRFKLRLWRGYFPKLAYKSQFVFVSEWMQKRFYHFTGILPDQLKRHCQVISNAVGSIFELQSYDPDVAKEYDFITLRSDMDISKYGVDIVNDLAKNNPNLTFLVIGRGRFFSHVPKADNITFIEGALPHEKIVGMLNRCRCGLMPTRQDTQGLMTCEFATFGIPVITSDIEVCREVLEGMPNVAFIDNVDTSLNLEPILQRLTAGVPYTKDKRYFAKNTVFKEIELLRRLVP